MGDASQFVKEGQGLLGPMEYGSRDRRYVCHIEYGSRDRRYVCHIEYGSRDRRYVCHI